MKKVLLRVLAFVVCAVMVLSLCACGEEEEIIDASENLLNKVLSDGQGVENANFRMQWDGNNKCVVFIEKATGKKWSTSPEQYLDAETKQPRARNYLASPLIVEYFSAEMAECDTARGYTECIASNKFDAVLNGNTISVGYYFKDANAYIVMDYTLSDDHFSISIDTDKIVEAENPIYSIKFAPYMCSVVTGTEDSYIFFPSGSGTIIDTSNKNLLTNEGQSVAVYGPDAAKKVKEKLTNDKNAYLPVFGVKHGDNALMGVMSSGAESAELLLSTNEEITQGFSRVCPELFLRGCDYNTIRGNNVYQETSIYADEAITDSVFTVDYYALGGEDANYVGMAKKYQSVLFGDNKATDIKENAFSLKIAGGLMQEKDFLGYPYHTLLPLTTYSDVKGMLDELSATGVTPNVQMYGFGESGLDVGEVAGGFALGSAFGSKKEIKEIMENCKNSGVDAFVDFDVTRYSEAGGGYTTMFDTAKTANKQAAYQYYISKSVQTQEEKIYDRFRLLKRDCVISAADKLLGKIDKYGLNGISFASLSDTAYSDYSDSAYFMKKNFGKMVQDIVAPYKDAGYSFAANGANLYAAQIADCIFEAPLNSSKYDVFTYDVPFYQMVFKGKTEMTSEAVNVGETLKKKELQALETGSSMLFTVYKTYRSELSFSPFKYLYGGVYESNKKDIVEVADNYKGFYDSISGQTIVNHEVLENNVRATTFSNGVKIYVNYGEKDYTCDAGTVQAMDCLIVK